MIEHGKVKSTVSPEPLIIDDYSVWVHSNIIPIEETLEDETFVGFEYDMVQYDKDEYIKIMTETNGNLEKQVTDLQIALVELFEGMGV